MKHEKILSEKNEFGGKTVEFQYESGDREFEEGILKLVRFFDTQERLIRQEAYLDDKNPKYRGMRFLIEELYDDGTLRKKTVYYSEDEMKKSWISHEVFEFERDGRLIKAERHYGDLIPDNEPFRVVKMEFDSEGKISRIECTYRDLLKDVYNVKLFVQEYSKDGKVIKTELYPTEESSKESGIVKSIQYHDENGEPREREWYYVDGRIEKEACYIREIKIEEAETEG